MWPTQRWVIAPQKNHFALKGRRKPATEFYFPIFLSAHYRPVPATLARYPFVSGERRTKTTQFESE